MSNTGFLICWAVYGCCSFMAGWQFAIVLSKRAKAREARIAELLAANASLQAHCAGLENQNRFLANAINARDARDSGIDRPIADLVQRPGIH